MTSKAEVNVGHIRDYDMDLGRINERDREYAADLIEDVVELGAKSCASQEQADVIAAWFRKVRYEAVMADRKKRSQS